MVWGSEQILISSSRIIDTVDFKGYYSVRENQAVVENLLWFWANLLAGGVAQAGENGSLSQESQEKQKDSGFTNLKKYATIGEKLAEDSGLMEVLHCLAFSAGPENLRAAKRSTIYGTALWAMQNVCQHPTFVTESKDTVFCRFIYILRQILFENLNFEEEVTADLLLHSSLLLSKLL